MDVVQSHVCARCGQALSIRFTYSASPEHRATYLRCPECEHLNPISIGGERLTVRRSGQPDKKRSA